MSFFEYQLKNTVFHGPNLFAPHKAIVVEIDKDIFKPGKTISPFDLECIRKEIPELLWQEIIKFPGLNDFVELDGCQFLELLCDCFMNVKQPSKLPVRILQNVDGSFRLVCGFYNEHDVMRVISIVLQITLFLYSEDGSPLYLNKDVFQKRLEALIASRKPRFIADMNNIAFNHNIPSQYLDAPRNYFLFGQGHKGVLYKFASNDADSYMGFVMQRDKRETNLFLSKLGIPVARQNVISTFEQCKMAIKDIGFPVVMKPLDQGQGRGVSVNICTIEQAKEAFQDIRKISDNNIVVEQFLEGSVYRITVSQGKLNTVYEMIPPFVIGDGSSTIAELIELENISRRKSREKGLAYSELIVNKAVLNQLSNDKMNIQTVPDKGRKVFLKRTSNTAAGGTYQLINDDDVHDDVKQLMIDIRENFRLDNVGIDYVTNDISKSWRDHGHIIEVNAFPSIEAKLIENIFINHFGEDYDCRVPTKLIVTENNDFSIAIYNDAIRQMENTGFTNSKITLFKGGEMNLPAKTIQERTLALLLNKTLHAVVVSMTPLEIEKFGLPIDQFDECVIDPQMNIDTALKDWIRQFVSAPIA